MKSKRGSVSARHVQLHQKESDKWNPTEKLPSGVDGRKYRDPQLHNIQRVRDYGIFIPK